MSILNGKVSKLAEKLKTPEELSRMKEEAEERAAKAKEIHRAVVDTIVSMVDAVGENHLMEKLHFLDAGSWDEIVEERYLARICGYPTCSSAIIVEHYMGKKFWLKRGEGKAYTAIPKSEKFCSRVCFHRSNHVQKQLYEEPMWFNWDRPNKAYDLEGFSQDSGVKSGGKSDFLVDDVDRLLVTRLNDLMIAENHESDSEKEDDEDEEAKTKKHEDDEFMNDIRSFVSSISNMTTARKQNLSGAGGVKTDMNNIGAQKKAEEKAKRYRKEKENVEMETEEVVEKQKAAKMVIPKKNIVKTSSKLERLIEDFTENHKEATKKTVNALESQNKPSESPSKHSESTSSPSQPSQPIKKIVKKPKKIVKEPEEEISPEYAEKLAKLRSKYGQKPSETAKKPPILIEAPPMAAEKAAKLSEDMR